MRLHDIHSMRNKHQLEYIFVGIGLAVFALILSSEGLVYASVGILSPFLIIIPLVFMPCKFTFDEVGITFHYLFLRDENYSWSDIELIETEFHGNGKYMYVIREKIPREEKRFKQYKFPKRRKSEVALSLYYTGKIEDEQRDGIPWR